MVTQKQKIHYPLKVELSYQKRLHAMVEALTTAFEQFIRKRHPPRLNLDSADDVEVFKKQLDQFTSSLGPIYGEHIAKQIVSQVTRDVYNNIERELAKVLPVKDDEDSWINNVNLTPKELEFLQAKANENVSYIKSLGDEQARKLEQIILRGVATGELAGTIGDEFAKATDQSLKRANVIARNETGSLYAGLNKFKQEGAGIKYFRWRTSEDDRVRQSHREVDGKIFSWSEGWEGTFPGMPINCRCVAEPVFDDEVEEAGEEEFWSPEETPRTNVNVIPAESYITNGGQYADIYQRVWTSAKPPAGVDVISERATEYLHDVLKQPEFTSPELKAIKSYTLPDYKVINSYLRGLLNSKDSNQKLQFYSGELNDLIDNLDHAISKTELAKPMVFMRSLKDSELAYYVNQIEAENNLDGYTSLTTNFGLRFGKHKLKVLVPKGTGIGMWVADKSKYPDQNEFLLRRGIKFKIVSREKHGSRITLTVEVVIPDEKS